MKALWVAMGLLGGMPVSARTWTDVQGRTIEADFISADDSTVTLRFRGKETKLPLSRLSEEDREWIDENGGEPEAAADAPAAGALTLCGVELKPGGPVVTVETDLDEKTLKAFRKSDTPPAKLKLAVKLPEGFDPAKPQRVLWVSAAINNDAERKAGNCAAINGYADTAAGAGWVVIAADTDQGNPRGEDNLKEDGVDGAVHQMAIETLAAAWPGFTAWEFACCGHSGGAKATFFRVAQLLGADLDVRGAYFSGCNQDMTEAAKGEVRFTKSKLRKVRAYISNGKGDSISTVAHAEALEKSVDSSFGDVELHLFEGGHVINREELKKALDWFTEA